jgi:hypothetical protein
MINPARQDESLRSNFVPEKVCPPPTERAMAVRHERPATTGLRNFSNCGCGHGVKQLKLLQLANDPSTAGFQKNG